MPCARHYDIFFMSKKPLSPQLDRGPGEFWSEPRRLHYNGDSGTDAMLTSSTTQDKAGAPKNETAKNQASLLQELTTERQNEASQGFDTKSALDIARIINHEDSKVAAAVKKAKKAQSAACGPPVAEIDEP